jgi:HlyD family secretion protein
MTCTRARVGLVSLVVALTVSGCKGDTAPDAFGNFEADEVLVSAETAGQLRAFAPVEGMMLDSGAMVASVDTVQLSLDRDRLIAERASLLSRRREAAAQLEALASQQQVATRAWRRAQRLVAADAGTASQVDQAERDVRVIDGQVVTTRAALSRVDDDASALTARLAQVTDRLARASVRAPVAGTVLATYVRVGEVIQPGQPLFRIADLRVLTLRAYVSGDQLTQLRLGGSVSVTVSSRGESAPVQGTVQWISPKAEFTPTPVQTRDERADLMYAVKIRVPNADGLLKIGMPADVSFVAPVASAARVAP